MFEIGNNVRVVNYQGGGFLIGLEGVIVDKVDPYWQLEIDPESVNSSNDWILGHPEGLLVRDDEIQPINKQDWPSLIYIGLVN